MRTLRVAVVGAGPGGLYAADALTYQTDAAVTVDVLDAQPTPFGLLRYGVAPDHLKMKSLARGLQKVLDDPRVRLFGDVTLGRDLSVDELRACYDAVVYAVGAPADRRLGIPGEDLPGSTSATAFVAWYSGHPDHHDAAVDLTRPSAAVVGLGNVAVDVVRILLKPVDQLRATDMPDHVLAALAASAVTDVHVLGRRGPAQARWTHKELRELGDLPGVDVLVDPFELSPADLAAVAADPNLARTVAIVTEWVGRAPTGAPKRLHLHFWAVPLSLVGSERVTGVQLAGTVVPADLVLRSVGYLGVELPGVPFDPATGTIPNDAEGRVLRAGQASPGEYAAGWARRGPSGVIGTNRPDGELVSAAVVADAAALVAGPDPGHDALPDLLAARGRPHVDLSGWAAIDAAEIARGAAQGRPRAKLHHYDDLRTAARSRP